MFPLTRKAAALAVASLVALAAPGGYAAYLQHSRNFHAVVEGEAYRSAQPDVADLADWTAQKGLRSVVNLRGADPEAEWYREEIAASERLGLTHADFAMSASQVLPQERAAALVALLARMPKPVLIHCRAGADRTSLAAALYLAASGAGEGRAEDQISFRYGHVALPLTAAWPMDQSWEALEPWLGYAG